MITIEDAVEVAAPVEAAFAFVIRIEDYPAWLPGVLRAEPADPSGSAGAAPGPGAGFRLVSAGPGGVEIVSHGRVEDVAPPDRIAIAATSPFFALAAACELAALDGGRCRIAVRATVEPRGIAVLAAGRLERELREAVPDTLRRLREGVEGSAAG